MSEKLASFVSSTEDRVSVTQKVRRQRDGAAVRAGVRTLGTEVPGYGLCIILHTSSRRMKTCSVVLSLYSIRSVLAMGWPG